jgi:hypothetical protein
VLDPSVGKRSILDVINSGTTPCVHISTTDTEQGHTMAAFLAAGRRTRECGLG